MRKKRYISKLTTKDSNMLKAFSRVGYLTEEMLKEDLEIADRRIKNFQRDNYIEKVSYLNKKTKNAEFALRLTVKGKKLCTNNLGIDSFYSSTSPHHDLGLAHVYFSISEEDRENWIVEDELRTKFQEHIKNFNPEEYERLNKMLESREISPSDGGYIDQHGNLVAVEVTTSSYRANNIQAKEMFAEILSIEYKQFRV